MNEKKSPTEYSAESAVESSYQTGSTKPPKSHVGFIAFVLSAVIFLCGISTILSLMRINLLQKLSKQAETQYCTLSFVSQSEHNTTGQTVSELGFQGKTLPAFWQNYRALPEGVYVTYAEAGKAVRAGDVLLTLDGQPVTDMEYLLELMDQYDPGDSIHVTVYRNGLRKQLNLTICDK